MSFHFIVKFEPPEENAAEFRDELLLTVSASRMEPGCISINGFETVHEPIIFSIHSEWVDEDAFELHATMPHTERFVAAAERLTGQPVKGLRLKKIGGGGY